MAVDDSGLSFSPLGDRALLIELGGKADPAIIEQLRALGVYLDAQEIPGVLDLVPALQSIGVHYDPEQWRDASGRRSPYEVLVERLQKVLIDLSALNVEPGQLVEIPVCYTPEFGEDLESLAITLDLSVEQLVSIHSAVVYSVYMVGFAPGFAYLGPLDARLHVPRRETPRARVPAGSVAVANEYTGIYPSILPGGWHLIGRTPEKLFDASRMPPSHVSAGDRVQFVPVTAGEFQRLLRRKP